MKIINPSILNVDIFEFETKMDLLKKNKIENIHYDVMDGLFVTNLALNVDTLKSIQKKYNFNFYVHIMMQDPTAIIKKFIEAKVTSIIFHLEPLKKKQIIELLNLIKGAGIKAGLAIKPNTKVSEIYKYIDKGLVDGVTLMSVEPGYGGQKFIESTISKINELSIFKEKNNKSFFVEIDGGVNQEVVDLLNNNKGVDYLVCGSHLMNSKDFSKTYKELIKK